MTEVQKLTILNDLIKNNDKNLENIFGQVDVIIATLSLSMGLDVPNIKGVIHYNFPKLLETYIQQIGRSGWNGEISSCYLLLNKDDLYFTRNKTISDFLISSIDVWNFLEYVTSRPGEYIYLSKEVFKGRLGIREYGIDRFLSVLKIVLDEMCPGKYDIFYNIKNQVTLKNYNRKTRILEEIEKLLNGLEEEGPIKDSILKFCKSRSLK